VNYLKIGFIKRPHGLKGELKVLPLTDNPERFNVLKKIFLEIKNLYIDFDIQSVKHSNNEIIIKFKDINDISKAEELKNKYIFIEREKGIDLDDWEYYSQDLIGCKVYYNEIYYGDVIDIDNFGANDNLLIRYNNNELYFPFLKNYIKEIVIENKKIILNNIEGFFD
jgi:16S rRNA processing protein RimM